MIWSGRGRAGWTCPSCAPAPGRPRADRTDVTEAEVLALMEPGGASPEEVFAYLTRRPAWMAQGASPCLGLGSVLPSPRSQCGASQSCVRPMLGPAGVPGSRPGRPRPRRSVGRHLAEGASADAKWYVNTSRTVASPPSPKDLLTLEGLHLSVIRSVREPIRPDLRRMATNPDGDDIGHMGTQTAGSDIAPAPASGHANPQCHPGEVGLGPLVRSGTRPIPPRQAVVVG